MIAFDNKKHNCSDIFFFYAEIAAMRSTLKSDNFHILVTYVSNLLLCMHTLYNEVCNSNIAPAYSCHEIPYLVTSSL